jgi:hypothetical protein
MANQIRFGCIALPTGKQGILKPDADGCYEMVVGGLNVYNSVGQYYPYEEARSIFESSAQLQRRVSRGSLKGEEGHPKWLPGMTKEQFIERVMSIYEDRVCCLHKELWLDFDRIKDDEGRKVIAIMSRVCPSGPHGAAFERSLQNPGENVCFSIRSFTEDVWVRGTMNRILRTVVTFDRVTEPGIAFANKWKSPALESLDDALLSRGEIQRAVCSAQEKQSLGLGMESALLTGAELFNAMNWQMSEEQKPGWARW